MRYLNKIQMCFLSIDKIFVLSFLTVLLILSPSAFAANDNYTIKIESISQTTTTINQDIEQAYQVLEQQLSNAREGLRPGYDEISSLVDQYQYIDENNKRYLLITFDKKTTQNYFKAHHITQKQPNTDNTLLLYVTQEVGSTKTLLDTETDSQIIQTITAQAFQEGINLISPTTDLNDIDSVSYDDVWHANLPVLEASAKKYQAKGLLIVHLKRNEGDEWHSTWHLYQSHHHNAFNASDAPIAQLALQAMQNIKGQQAKNNTPILQDINIEAMHQSAQNAYQQTLTILKKTPGILNVQIQGVTPDSVFYKLSINTDKDELINTLKGHKNILKFRVAP